MPAHRIPVVGRRASVAVLVSLVAVAPLVSNGSAVAAHRPGDVLRRGGLSLVVPPAGRGVFAAAINADGSVTTFGIQTESGGDVLLDQNGLGEGSFPGDGQPGGASPSACTDSAYSLAPTSWSKTYSWYFNAASTPSGFTQGAAAGALKSAVNNITMANNDCGLPDLVSATNSYKGTTTATPNISNASACLSGDGKNVVGFGTLSSSYVGYACWWTIGNATVEADVKLNKTNFAWYVTKPNGCSNMWDVQAVSTHEFGHVFGLLDLDASKHANLTMSADINACQNSQDTLGLGDILGLQAKY